MKELNIEELKQYDIIYVSGPQRCGTTVMSKYLSNKLGYKLIDEEDYNIHYLDKLNKLINGKCVIQCPALTHKILDFNMNNAIIIWMKRDYYDIIKSEKRINWNNNGGEAAERRKYKEFTNYYLDYIPISIIKNKVWDELQKNKVNHIELNYDFLKQTEIYEKDRKNFKPKQTRR